MHVSTPKTILFVEDEKVTAMLLSKQFQNTEYLLEHVSNGEKALEVVSERDEIIDLILMDIDLGDGKISLIIDNHGLVEEITA